MFGKILFCLILTLSIASLIFGIVLLITEFVIIGILGFIASYLIFKEMQVSFKDKY